MLKKAVLATWLIAAMVVCAHAQNIAGDYGVAVIGTNVFMDRPENRQRVDDRTTLKVTQQGDDITMELGAIGDASKATIFKGKTGSDRFAAVWWYKGYPHETKVLWGMVHEDRLKGHMIFPRASSGRGLQPGWLQISFEAVKKPAAKPPAPVGNIRLDKGQGLVVGAPGESLSFKEDCLGFDPRKVGITAESGGVLMTDGRSRMKMFPNTQEASRAFNTIRHYGMDQHCFVGRPDPSMEYWTAKGKTPKGRMENEDCIAFDPGRLQLKPEGSKWLMTDGRSRMRTFPNRKEAEQALAIIKKYGFDKTCYVGRPGPSMTYFRK